MRTARRVSAAVVHMAVLQHAQLSPATLKGEKCIWDMNEVLGKYHLPPLHCHLGQQSPEFESRLDPGFLSRINTFLISSLIRSLPLPGYR